MLPDSNPLLPQAGHCQAQFNLGNLFYQDKRLSAAIHWYSKAAEQVNWHCAPPPHHFSAARTAILPYAMPPLPLCLIQCLLSASFNATFNASIPLCCSSLAHTAICADRVHAQGDEEAQYNLDLALNLGIGSLDHAHESKKDKVKFVKRGERRVVCERLQEQAQLPTWDPAMIAPRS